MKTKKNTILLLILTAGIGAHQGCIFSEKRYRIIVENRIKCQSRLGIMFFNSDTSNEIVFSETVRYAAIDEDGWGPFDSKIPWPKLFEKYSVDSVYFYLVKNDTLSKYGWPKLYKMKNYLDYKVIKVSELVGSMNSKIISNNTRCD